VDVVRLHDPPRRRHQGRRTGRALIAESRPVGNDEVPERCRATWTDCGNGRTSAARAERQQRTDGRNGNGEESGVKSGAGCGMVRQDGLMRRDDISVWGQRGDMVPRCRLVQTLKSGLNSFEVVASDCTRPHVGLWKESAS
jgi:hypothetical protein